MSGMATPPVPAGLLRLSLEEAERYPLIWSGDVAVIGGGSAGAAAATAAARQGASTLVLEAGGFFGGTAVAVLDTMYGFFPAGSNERIVGGIGWEVASGLLGRNEAILRGNTYGAGTGVTYEPEALKMAWDRTLSAAGVVPVLHSRLIAVVADDSKVVGATVLTRRGPHRIEARRLVDATGDAQVAWSAGAALELPEAGRRLQPLTTTFRVGGVGTPVPTAELHRLMEEAAASGDYRLPRREGSSHPTLLPGVFHTNLTRVTGVDSTDPWAATQAEIEGRRQSLEYMRFLRDRVPGYESAYLLTTSVWIGTRETRRLLGEYVLTREDVVAARSFDDAIALCGAPIEDHDDGASTLWHYVGTEVPNEQPVGRHYGIPYRCLVPRDVDGLLVTGRALSATHDAHASARSIGQCLAYGEAAGTAAALSIAEGVEPRALDTTLLRQELARTGGIL